MNSAARYWRTDHAQLLSPTFAGHKLTRQGLLIALINLVSRPKVLSPLTRSAHEIVHDARSSSFVGCRAPMIISEQYSRIGEIQLARVEEVTVTMVDDLDGGSASESIAFALEGASYEIDLSKRNAEKLRHALKPYLEAGRKVKRSKGRRPNSKARSASSRSEDYDRAEVRAWAKSHRIKVASRGRISSDVVERWRHSSGN
jgi:hypothetical protein